MKIYCNNDGILTKNENLLTKTSHVAMKTPFKDQTVETHSPNLQKS